MTQPALTTTRGGTQRLRNRRAYAIPSAATYSMYLNQDMMKQVDQIGREKVKSRSEIVEACIKLGLRAHAKKELFS
jgi:hypothetical protein